MRGTINIMKIFYLTGLINSLLFIGCSSTYTFFDFSSKEKFYEDFNNSNKSQEVQLTLTNDSTLNLNGHVNIINNMIYYFGVDTTVLHTGISIKDVKQIKYKNHWAGISTGIVSGFVLGFGTSLIDLSLSKDQVKNERYVSVLIPSPIGIILGGVVGYVFGWTYTYQFNP